MDDIKNLSRLIYVFQTFRLANIVASSYTRLQKSILRKWIYYTFPIIIFSINLFNLIRNEVLYAPSDKFTYFNDLSNSLCLSLLYFLSYFLSGYYPLKFDEFIKNGIDKEFFGKLTEYSKNKKTSKFLLYLTKIILLCISVAAGYSFYSVAKSNIDAYWIYNLDIVGRTYYCLFLGVTWYHSLSLLGMALTSGFIVYKTIESKHIIYIDDDFNKNISIMSAMDIVLSTFSYGLFYIIGSFLFIFNDRVAEKYNVYNTFHEDLPSFILVLVITLLVVWAYLPLQELFLFMKKKKDSLVGKLNEMIVAEKNPEIKEKITIKRNNLIEQNLIYTTFTNKMIFILSVFIPSVGVIFQGIDLFVK